MRSISTKALVHGLYMVVLTNVQSAGLSDLHSIGDGAERFTLDILPAYLEDSGLHVEYMLAHECQQRLTCQSFQLWTPDQTHIFSLSWLGATELFHQPLSHFTGPFTGWRRFLFAV